MDTRRRQENIYLELNMKIIGILCSILLNIN